MTYNIIASGSQGNAIVLNDEIPIDCGVPFSALERHYRGMRLVLLTHQHSDHFNPATIKRLHYMRPGLRFVVPPWLFSLVGSLTGRYSTDTPRTLCAGWLGLSKER